MRVGYNPIAETVLNNLKRTDTRRSEAQRKLATGNRIDSSKDDAAGMAVSSQLKADIVGKKQVARGLADGVSYCRTAEGALGTIQAMVMRGCDLAVEAAGDQLSDEERAMLDAELLQIKEQIDKIAQGTEIFGRHPLLGSASLVKLLSSKLQNGASATTFPSGIRSFAIIPANTQNISVHINDNGLDDTIELFTRDGKHLAGTDLSDGVWTANVVDASNVEAKVLTAANGFSPGAVYDASNLNDAGGGYNPAPPYSTSSHNGMTIGYSGTDNPSNYNEYLNIDTVTEDLVLMVVGSGAFDAQAAWDTMPGVSHAGEEDVVGILAESTFRGDESFIDIPKTPADIASLGIADIGLTPAEKAREALRKLQEAMDQISGHLTTYGAKMNILENRIDAVQIEILNESSAMSTVKDADVASEVTELAKSQILREAGMSALSEANLLPQSILSLLKSE